MSNKKRKAKILRATVKYLGLKAARHERILEIHRTELAGVGVGLKRLLEMYKLLNANKEN
jgi:hypothetical protein